MKNEAPTQGWRPSFPEPIMWASLEIGSFALLFLSVFLDGYTMSVLWKGMALWRTVSLGSMLQEGASLKKRGAMWLRSLSYGLPFWSSSLLFPLKAHQSVSVAEALALYLVLSASTVLVSGFKTYWFPGLVALLTAGFWGWFQQDWVLLAVGVALGAALFFVSVKRDLEFAMDTPASRMVAAGLSASWVAMLVWAVLLPSMRELAQSLLVWLVLSAVSAQAMLSTRQEVGERKERREVELSLPGLPDALRYCYASRLRRSTLPWSVLLLVCVWGGQTAWLAVLVLVSLFGLQQMLVKEFVGPLNWQWWSCGLFVLFWGAAESEGVSKYGWLAVGFFLALAVMAQRSLPLVPAEALAGPGLSSLEQMLRSLKVQAPEGLAREILSQSEPSVDIDDSLHSSAPEGFRQRLLERLKRAEAEEGQDSTEL